MTSTAEGLFVTQDIGKTFDMIEDENGDVFWGYGHRDGPEFIEQVNLWLIHACGATVPDDLFPLNEHVEHLWARMDDEYGERFTLVGDYGNDALKRAADVFPVTRLTFT